MAHIPADEPSIKTLTQRITALEKELRLLQTRPAKDNVPGQVRFPLSFTCHGDVLVEDPSASYLMKDFSGQLLGLDITARTGGAEKSTYVVLRNGDVLFEGTLDEGETYLEQDDLTLEFEEYDKISVDWTEVGEGLAGVTMTFQVVAIEGEDFA